MHFASPSAQTNNLCPPDICLPVCPPHLALGHLHFAYVGTRRKNEGLRGGKEELGYSRMRHIAPGAAVLPRAAPKLSRHWVGEQHSQRRAVFPPPHQVNHLQTLCAHSEASGKTLPKDREAHTHMIWMVESWNTSGKDRRQL